MKATVYMNIKLGFLGNKGNSLNDTLGSSIFSSPNFVIGYLLPVSGKIQQTTNWRYFSKISPKNRILHVMQIASIGENLHEMSKSVFWEK